MAYYDALKTAWNGATQPPIGVTGTALAAGMTTQQKLDAVNGWTVPGPNIDVAPSTVQSNLLLLGAYFTLEAFSQGANSGDQTHDKALYAAKALIKLLNSPNASVFQMSDANKYAQIKGMMDNILAQEVAVPGSTGFTQSVHDSLLALAATTTTWWQANGYSRQFDLGDVAAAGLS